MEFARPAEYFPVSPESTRNSILPRRERKAWDFDFEARVGGLDLEAEFACHGPKRRYELASLVPEAQVKKHLVARLGNGNSKPQGKRFPDVDHVDWGCGLQVRAYDAMIGVSRVLIGGRGIG
jgi:hypothetical protein